MLKFLILIIIGALLLSFNVYMSYLSGSRISIFVNVFLLVSSFILLFKPRSTLSRILKKDYSFKPTSEKSVREYWVHFACIWMVLAIAGVLLTASIHKYYGEFPPIHFGVTAYFIAPIFSLVFFLKAIISVVNAIRKKKLDSGNEHKFGELMRYEAYIETNFDELESVLMSVQTGLDDPSFVEKISEYNESISKYEQNEKTLKVLFEGYEQELTYSIYIDGMEKVFIYFYSYSEEIISKISKEAAQLKEENLML